MFKRVIKTKISHDYFSHNVGMHGTRTRALFCTSAAVATAAAVYRCLDLLKDLLHLSNRLPVQSPPSTADTKQVYKFSNTIFAPVFPLLIICLHALTIFCPSRIAISFMFRYLLWYPSVSVWNHGTNKQMLREKTFTHGNR